MLDFLNWIINFNSTYIKLHKKLQIIYAKYLCKLNRRDSLLVIVDIKVYYNKEFLYIKQVKKLLEDLRS